MVSILLKGSAGQCSVQLCYKVYSVNNAACSVHSALCSMHYEECNLQCVVWRMQCAVRSVQCTVWRIQCAVCSLKSSVCSIQCVVCSVHFCVSPPLTGGDSSNPRLGIHTGQSKHYTAYTPRITNFTVHPTLPLPLSQPTKYIPTHILKLFRKLWQKTLIHWTHFILIQIVIS